MGRVLFVLSILFAMGAAAAAASTETYVLQPDASEGADAWISSGSPYTCTGLRDTLYVGRGKLPIVAEPGDPDITVPKTSVSYDWRSLLRFALPSLGHEATIRSAELALYARDVWPATLPYADPLRVGVHRVTDSWTEGTNELFSGVNWYMRDPPQYWLRTGGDYDGAVAALDTLHVAREWLRFDVTELVNGWYADPSAEHGLIVTREGGQNSIGVFVSSDDPEAAARPVLMIVVETPEPVLPAFGSGVAEIVPAEVPRDSLVTLALSARLSIDAAAESGVDRIYLPLAGGFGSPSPTNVRLNGADVPFADASSGDTLDIRLATAMDGDGTVEIVFDARTPPAPAPGGVKLAPYGDDSRTPYPPQSIAEGDGNGVPGDGDTYTLVVTPGPAVTIEVTPGAASVTADSTVLFAAAGYDEGGYETTIAPAWSVTGGVGSIDDDGLFDAGAVGAGWIIAAEGAVAGSASVEVSHGAAALLIVAPADTSITAQDSVLYAATLFDGDANPFAPAAVAWSEPGGLGVIDPSGLFVAASAGATIVVGVAEGIADTASLSIVPGELASLEVVPATDTIDTEGTISFAAVARDEGGNVIDDPGALVWSGGSSIGQINPATGLFAATAPGVDSVTVTGGPVSARSGPIVVVPGPTRSVTIAPGSAAMAVGVDTLFTAIARDGEGNPTGEAVAWSVTGGVGTVAGGFFTATAPGSGLVIASAGGVSDTAAVTVFDDAGIVIERVIESRSTVTRGEAGVEVALAVRNASGSSLTALAASLRFTAGGDDRGADYGVAAMPWDGGTLPDGARDTLLFAVDVGDSALAGVTVTIDGAVTGHFSSGGGEATSDGAAIPGSWTVGEAPVLHDVTRSLFPDHVVAGRDVAFAIALKNLGGTSVVLDPATTFTFGAGASAFEAPLLAPVTLAPGGDAAICLFGAAEAPPGLDAGVYPVTLNLSGEDGNGGRYDESMLAKANTLELLPPYVSVTVVAIEGVVVHPDADSIPLLRLRVANLYEEPRTLTSIRVTNGTEGPGTPVQRDGEWKAVRLVRDANRNGAWDAGDAILGTALFTGGATTFSGISFVVGGGDTAALLVAGDLDTAKARDGEKLNASVGAAGDLVFSGGSAVSAAFPLDSPGAHYVDGFVAAQLVREAPFPADLPAGANDSLALVLRVPSNGYAADTLRSLTVQNAGTATTTADIVEVRLWRDGGNGAYDRGAGDDTNLGALYWTGDGWTRSGLGLAVPAGGARLYLTVDASNDPGDQRTLRLRVPVDGILMASSNDGPIDAAAVSPGTRVFGGARRVVADLAGGAGASTVTPGQEDRYLFEFSLANIYPDSVHLEGMVLRNLSSGDAPDSVARFVKLYEGTLLSGGKRTGGAPIAVAPSVSGGFELSGFTANIGPGRTAWWTVGVDVGLHCVADGDTARVAIEGPDALLFRVARLVDGPFPLEAPAAPVVDGLAAAQLAVHPVPAGALTPTESGRLALSITIPPNGCRPDTLLGVRITNEGTADPVDVARLALSAGPEGSETALGDLVWNGQVWAREGIALPVPASGETIRVRADATAAARDGRTVALAVPAGGLTVASSNDGPVDGAVSAGALLRVSTSPLFATFELPAGPVSVGQEFDATLLVQNLTAAAPDTLEEVSPDSFRAGGAACTVIQSPAGGAATIAPGGEARFVWRLRSDAPGAVTLFGRAVGRRASDGSTVSSFLVESDPLTASPAPTTLRVNGVNTLPASVNRGERLVPLLVLSIAHGDPGGSGAAPIRVDTLRVFFEDDGGGAVSARDLLRGATVERGGAPIGAVDSASVGEGFLTVPLVSPITVAPGEEAAVEVLVDLLTEPAVGAFAGVLPSPTVIRARNAYSSQAVPVSGTFPIRTRIASVVVPPTALTASVRGGLPPRVNRGAPSVPILEFDLTSEGIAGVTADVSISAIKIVLSDWIFPFRSARVTGPGITHFSGGGWSVDAGVLTFPLAPPLTVPVNNPIEVKISGDIDEEAPLGPFRLGVADTLFIDPRTETDAGMVDVELLLTQPIETIVVVPTDSITASGTAGAGAGVAHPGDAGREVCRIEFVHPGGDTLSPVRVTGFHLRLEDGAGDSVEMRAVVARAQVRAASVIASAAPLADGSATLALPFSEAIPLEPGESASVGVEADLRADAPAGDYRFVVSAATVSVADGITGSPVALVFDGADAERYVSEPLTVRMMSDGVHAIVSFTLPPTTVGGALIEEGFRLKLVPSGGDDVSEVRFEGFALFVEDPGGDAVDPSGALRAAVASGTAKTSSVDGSFEGGEIRFAFDPPLAIAAAETLEITGDLEVADHPTVPAFRIRLPADRIRIAEGVPVTETSVEGGGKPSAYAHLAERSFETSLRNYPNPFAAGREETTIAFYARTRGRVEVRVYTGLGAPVRSWEAAVTGPGLVETRWDGRNGDGHEVLSGAYLASITVRYDDGESEHGIRKIAVLH